MKFHQRSDKAQSICRPRWEGVTEPVKRDPCDRCPLYEPCVRRGLFPAGLEPFNKWIDGINELAEKLTP